MATGALTFKVAPTVAVANGSDISKLASQNSYSPEQSSCFSFRERAGFGGVEISKKWTASVAPRASSLTVVSPSPAATEDCKEVGGSGKAEKMEDGRWHVQFDATEVNIPDVAFHTTTLLGIPLPPPIRIQIVPESLEGTVDRITGKVEMNFKAKFYFSTGRLYRPPPLVVDTLLTTESTQGDFRGGTGSRLDADGNCRMVGVARLAPIDDMFMDNFLMLPSDCLADMAANITFTLQ